MPIYAYRCEACGFAKDVLRKISDPPLTQCPECGKDTFQKQVTAAGFQLKGSGWYVTDFRGGSGGASATSSAPAANASGDAAPAGGNTAAPTGGDTAAPAGGSTAAPATPAAPASSSSS
ncbi:FmdB family zinc ribbon protein [Burkholderia guangdongensis]|uniref:FmdB family zinc ribbon protein n=1 Tax=Burkholderia guangdongensis TaxID=1792500 RepID=UPI0015CE79EA|nr:zinc ribbon domain-containing protein [Burkholderia guangdongensis]